MAVISQGQMLMLANVVLRVLGRPMLFAFVFCKQC